MASAPILALDISFQHSVYHVLHSHRLRRILYNLVASSNPIPFEIFAKTIVSNPVPSSVEVESIPIAKRDDVDETATAIKAFVELVKASATVYLAPPDQKTASLLLRAFMKASGATIDDIKVLLTVHRVNILYRPPRANKYPYNVLVLPRNPERANEDHLVKPVLVRNGKYYIRVCNEERCSLAPACYEGQPHIPELSTPDGYKIANVPAPFPGCDKHVQYLQAILSPDKFMPARAHTPHRRGRGSHRGRGGRRPRRRW